MQETLKIQGTNIKRINGFSYVVYSYIKELRKINNKMSKLNIPQKIKSIEISPP